MSLTTPVRSKFRGSFSETFFHVCLGFLEQGLTRVDMEFFQPKWQHLLMMHSPVLAPDSSVEGVKEWTFMVNEVNVVSVVCMRICFLIFSSSLFSLSWVMLSVVRYTGDSLQQCGGGTFHITVIVCFFFFQITNSTGLWCSIGQLLPPNYSKSVYQQ